MLLLKKTASKNSQLIKLLPKCIEDEIVAGQQHYSYSFNGCPADRDDKERIFKEANPLFF